MSTPAQTTAIEQVEKVRNRLAFFLVIAFVGVLPFLLYKTIPVENRDLITYMLGQLSGMATTVLGFYFVNKVGQDAADARRVDNTSKALEAITTVAQNVAPGDPEAPAGTKDDPLHVAGAAPGEPPVRTKPAGGKG